MSGAQPDSSGGLGLTGGGGCERLHRALMECHRGVPAGPPREAACRHLNRSLADCLVALVCPAESEAVRSLCSSAGTALKRSQTLTLISLFFPAEELLISYQLLSNVTGLLLRQ
ncbi:hypothetical protein F0562_029717 [Nyssa sinensis]|uniref:COX assembly mitochondrial protein n=1 Tax=Nyssa sinensis TaxID=561372 RepID=A0A5J5B7V9_9ASTE|nr:hypothetical protein F0562_029717 [Nyssa sinensis]